MTNEKIIQHTRLWIEQVVIANNFCPFASRPYMENKIAYWVADSPNKHAVLRQFQSYCEVLNTDNDIETAIIIIPNGFNNFKDYLTLLQMANYQLKANNLEGVFQLASFHPHYKFAGKSPKDVTNYTNRSPYPVLHLIREKSIESVRRFFKNIEAIPAKNITAIRQIGLDKMQATLQQILER